MPSRLPPITEQELDQEDYVQTVALGEARARRHFRPELGMPWELYRDLCVQTEIRAMTRARRRSRPRRGRLIPLDDLRAEPEVRQELAAALLLAETLALALSPLSGAERSVVLAVLAESIEQPMPAAARHALADARSKIRLVVPVR